MNIAAFLLALLAIITFVVADGSGRFFNRAVISIGLALFVAAYVAQNVWVTSHIVQIH